MTDKATSRHSDHAISVHIWRGLLVAITLVYLGASAPYVCAASSGAYMPPGVHFPTVRLPEPRPGDPAPNGGLRFAEANKVFHLIDFDRSPFRWADNTLRVGIGFQTQWNITDFYALFPEGYEGSEGKAVAFVSSLKVDFDQPFRSDRDEPLRSSNCPQYTLYREQEFLVLQEGDERRWYFESPDGGGRWRLARMELVKQPRQFTSLTYEGSNVTSIRFPNGKEATLKYQNDLPVEIHTPFGERVELQRSGDQVRELRIYRVDGDRQTLKARYQYAFEGSGRLTRFVNEFGVEYRMEYYRDDAIEDKTNKIIYSVVQRNMSDGTFTIRRQEAVGDEWTITDASGAKDQSIDQTMPQRMIRMRVVNERWSVIGRSHEEIAHETNSELDLAGNPTVQIDPLGRTTGYRYNEQGRPVETRLPSGGRIIEDRNAFGQVTRRVDVSGAEMLFRYDDAKLVERIDADGEVTRYEYNDRSFPIQTTIEDEVYRFAFDDWGRMTAIHWPNGRSDLWHYNAYGDITEHVVEHRRSSSSETPDSIRRSTTSYRFDPAGRLIATQQDNNEAERYIYGAQGRLLRCVRPDGKFETFEYDKAQRLLRHSDPNRRQDEYTYYPDGKIKTHRFLETGKTWGLKQYASSGLLITEDIAGQGTLTYEYDAGGRRTRITHSDGTDTTYSYDDLNRVIAVRGSHQPPMDYTYGPDGQRIQSPAAVAVEANTGAISAKKGRP